MKTLLVLMLFIPSNAKAFTGLLNDHEIYTENLATSHHETSQVFSADEGLELVRSARVEQGRKLREKAQAGVEYCFSLMHERVEEGECSAVFFAEDASCNGDQEATGCFENKVFRRKLSALEFKVRRQEIPTADPEDHCASITVSWCKDLRRHQ